MTGTIKVNSLFDAAKKREHIGSRFCYPRERITCSR